MVLENCKTCDKHGYYGNGYVICNYWNMNEQRITSTGKNNSVYIVSCPRENDLAINYKNDYPPRWNKNPVLNSR